MGWRKVRIESRRSRRSAVRLRRILGCAAVSAAACLAYDAAGAPPGGTTATHAAINATHAATGMTHAATGMTHAATGVTHAAAQRDGLPIATKAFYAGGDPGAVVEPVGVRLGMQLVQGGDAAFATLFVYTDIGAPTFYTATLARGPDGAWQGDLYRTTGPYFGLPAFAPAAVVARRVGTLSFAPSSAQTAALSYDVDGVAVARSVQRQTLHDDDYNGTFVGTLQDVVTNCALAVAEAASVALGTLVIAQSGTALQIDSAPGERRELPLHRQRAAARAGHEPRDALRMRDRRDRRDGLRRAERRLRPHRGALPGP